MTSAFYSDRTSGQRPCTGEEVTPEAWRGVLAIIKRRLRDGTLAKSFPIQDCIDGPFLITGTNTSDFEQLLVSLIPALKRQEDEEPGARRAPVSRPTPVLDPNRPPPTPVALDVVDFVMQYVATPMTRTNDDYWKHEHLTFNEESENSKRAEFAREVELIFQRNGIGFTFGSDLQVVRLGPPEARELLSDFAPRTGDADLDSKLRDATTRFLSRDLQQRVDALEKLWDAFERFKTLELGGDKKASFCHGGRRWFLGLRQGRGLVKLSDKSILANPLVVFTTARGRILRLKVDIRVRNRVRLTHVVPPCRHKFDGPAGKRTDPAAL